MGLHCQSNQAFELTESEGLKVGENGYGKSGAPRSWKGWGGSSMMPVGDGEWGADVPTPHISTLGRRTTDEPTHSMLSWIPPIL